MSEDKCMRSGSQAQRTSYGHAWPTCMANARSQSLAHSLGQLSPTRPTLCPECALAGVKDMTALSSTLAEPSAGAAGKSLLPCACHARADGCPSRRTGQLPSKYRGDSYTVTCRAYRMKMLSQSASKVVKSQCRMSAQHVQTDRVRSVISNKARPSCAA